MKQVHMFKICNLSQVVEEGCSAQGTAGDHAAAECREGREEG